MTNSGKKDDNLFTAENIFADVRFVRSGRYLFITKYEIKPSNETFKIAFRSSTKPLTEKIFFKPFIGFIFSNFQ